MVAELQVFIDRLKDGHTEEIEEQIGSEILDIDEPSLSFGPHVMIEGKVYLADDHLVVHLSLRAEAKIPCSICNETVTIPLQIKDFNTTLPLTEIPSHILDLTDILREAILLNTPPFAECHQGHCPQRERLKKYLKGKAPSKENVQFPFSDLE